MKESNSNGINGNGTNSDRNALGRFVRGHRRMGGRKVGARNRLSERFLDDLRIVWVKGGRQSLEKTIKEDPIAIAKIVASLFPKELLIAHNSINIDVKTTPEFLQMEDFMTGLQTDFHGVFAYLVPPVDNASRFNAAALSREPGNG